MTWLHEGHDVKRGPMVEFTGGTGLDVARWTDEDYEANKDWIETL